MKLTAWSRSSRPGNRVRVSEGVADRRATRPGGLAPGMLYHRAALRQDGEVPIDITAAWNRFAAEYQADAQLPVDVAHYGPDIPPRRSCGCSVT